MSHFVPCILAFQMNSKGEWLPADNLPSAYDNLSVKTVQAAFCFEALLGMGYFPLSSSIGLWDSGGMKIGQALAESQRVSISKKDQP